MGIACVLLKCGMGEGQVVAGNGIEHLGNLGILEIACVSAFEQNTHYFQDSEISEMLITLSGWPRWWWVGGRDVVKLSRHHPAGNSLTPCFHVRKSVCFSVVAAIKPWAITETEQSARAIDRGMGQPTRARDRYRDGARGTDRSSQPAKPKVLIGPKTRNPQ